MILSRTVKEFFPPFIESEILCPVHNSPEMDPVLKPVELSQNPHALLQCNLISFTIFQIYTHIYSNRPLSTRFQEKFFLSIFHFLLLRATCDFFLI